MLNYSVAELRENYKKNNENKFDSANKCIYLQ